MGFAPRDRRLRENRVFLGALMVSALLHLVAAGARWTVQVPPPAESGQAWNAANTALQLLRLAPPVESGGSPSASSPIVSDEIAPDPAPERAAAEIDRAPVPPEPPPRRSAAERLRAAGVDPRLFGGATPPPSAPVAQDGSTRGVERWLASPPEIEGADSLKLASWGDRDGDLQLRPGLLVIRGVALPFCGGPDAERCGFGVRPWDLERADREAEFLRGLEEQARWETLQERARAMRGRSDARRDTTPEIGRR